MIDTTKPFTSAELIHNNASIVDLKFIKRDKQYFLNRVQYWKNYLKKHNHKTILIASNPSIDTIALFFASAECGVLIATSNLIDGPEAFLRRSAGADMHFINPFFESDWFDQRDPNRGPLNGIPLYVLNEADITQDFESTMPTYVPDLINPDADLITGEINGFPDSKIAHTSGRFMHGGLLCTHMYNTEDRFGAMNGITHIGLITQTVLGPLFAGAMLYTLNGFFDVVFLACRNIFTKVFFYEVHLKLTEWHPNFKIPINAFKGCTVFTAGFAPTPKLMDSIFNCGADKIYSCFGTFLAASPLFELEIASNKHDVYTSGLGKITKGVDIKIVDDKLWVRSPSQSKYTKNLDNDGYFCTHDYVRVDDRGVYHFLGRERLDTISGNKVFSVDINNTIQSVLDVDLFHSEYMYEFVNGVVNIYPLSKVAKETLTRNSSNVLKAINTLLEKSDLEQIVIHSIVDDASLFAGRITMGRVKQLIAEGKTL